MKKTLTLIFVLLAIVSFTYQESTPAMIKGKVKCIHFYQSGTKQYYTYDNEGRVLCIQKPYGKKDTFSYAGNLIYIEHFDPRGYVHHDTMILKGSQMVDSIVSDKSFWQADYDLDRTVTKEVYVPLKGKNRKPGRVMYTYTYNYYCGIQDATGKSDTSNPCIGYTGHKWIKTEIGVDAKNDTFYYLSYKYLFNKNNGVNTRMRYYRTGQLYDSIGYTYY